MPTVNAIKRALANKTTVKGVHFTFPSPPILEILARLGLDFVYFDGEHGTFNRENLEHSCALAEKFGITPIARVPSNSVPAITQFLDAGVRGIVVPHVESVAEGKAAIAAAYFAPVGERSFGAGRPEYAVGVGGLPEFIEKTNSLTSLCLMIESEAGLNCVDELAALDGVDYLSFGMMDLSQSLGHAGNPGHPEVKEKVAAASEKIRAAGKRVREDFMHYCWMRDLVVAGAGTLLDIKPTT
jgi:2-keto-3-deoxy-L-rhamnonate aldolase RhmA